VLLRRARMPRDDQHQIETNGSRQKSPGPESEADAAPPFSLRRLLPWAAKSRPQPPRSHGRPGISTTWRKRLSPRRMSAPSESETSCPPVSKGASSYPIRAFPRSYNWWFGGFCLSSRRRAQLFGPVVRLVRRGRRHLGHDRGALGYLLASIHRPRYVLDPRAPGDSFVRRARGHRLRVPYSLYHVQ
jgi:hypothetical protein